MCGLGGWGAGQEFTRGEPPVMIETWHQTLNPTPLWTLYSWKVLTLCSKMCDRPLSTHLDCSIFAEETQARRQRSILTSLLSWGVSLSSFWTFAKNSHTKYCDGIDKEKFKTYKKNFFCPQPSTLTLNFEWQNRSKLTNLPYLNPQSSDLGSKPQFSSAPSFVEKLLLSTFFAFSGKPQKIMEGLPVRWWGLIG